MNKFCKFLTILLIVLFGFCFCYVNIIAGSAYNDYSKDNSIDSINYSASDFLSLIIGSDLTIEEKEYIDSRYSESYFSYDYKINPNNINTSIDDDVLTIHAEEYYYSNNKNYNINWIPYSVKALGNTYYFNNNGDTYEVKIDGIGDSDSVYIKYKANVSISKESINSILNVCFDDVDKYVCDLVYEKNYQIYLDDLDKYNNYLKDIDKYNADLGNYNKYLSDLNKWENDTLKYNEYLKEYNNYLDELNKYNKYLNDLELYNNDLLAYQDYLSALEKYNNDYDQIIDDYNAYIKVKNKVDRQLYIVNLINTNMTELNRTIYSAVMGETVTQVLSMREDLKQLNAPEEAIDRAEKATLYLRGFFESYFSCESDSEKYQVYSTNYSKFKNNLEELLRCLDKLYRSGLVSEALNYKGSTEKYLILVAQLALVCNALDNNPVYNYEAWNTKTKKGNLNFQNAAIIDENWKINNRTYDQILGEIFIDDYDFDTYPISGGYPSEVKLPVEPSEVKNPTKPDVVKCPIEPSKVNDPGDKPSEVIMPTYPDEVIKPTEYVRPEYITKLLNVYKSSLNRRDEYNSDYNLELESEFSKKIKNLDVLTIEFYDLDGELLDKASVDKGSYISYNGIIPIKSEDDVYQKYNFVGWAYSDGTLLDTNNVLREGFVYPVFDGVLREFNVSWNIDGNITTEVYKYGDIPEYKNEVKKDNDYTYYYVFKSFDKELSSVTSDVTYVALFDKYYLVSFNEDDTFGADINISDNKIEIEADEYDGYEFNLERLINNINNPYCMLDINSKNVSISIDSYQFSKMFNNKVNNIKLVNVDDVYYLDIDGEDDNYLININISGSFDSNNTKVYCIDESDELVSVRCELSNDRINFSINSKYRYRIYSSYSINKLNVSNVSYMIDKLECKSGELVNIIIDKVNEGIKIDKIYVIDENNNQITVNNDNSFVMPNSDVTVGITCSYIEYVVTFVSDGVIISSNTYHYGDKLISPKDPIIISDEYIYEFIGWDESPNKTVTEDKVYTAVFEVRVNDSEGVQKRKSIIKTVKIIVLVIALLGLSAGFGFLIFKLLKKEESK